MFSEVSPPFSPEISVYEALFVNRPTHAHTGGSSFLAHLNADDGIVVVQWDFVSRVH